MNISKLLQHKNIMATAFAIAGLSLAFWAVWRPGLSNRAIPASAPHPVEATTHEETEEATPAQTLEYIQLNNRADVDKVMSDFQQEVQALARADDGLKALGEEAIQSFATAATLAIKPSLLGSFEDYKASVLALGGEPVEQKHYEDKAILAFHKQYAMRPVSPHKGVQVVPFVRYGVERSFQKRMESLGDSGMTGKIGFRTSTAPKRYPSVASYRQKKLEVYEVHIPMLALAYKDPEHEIPVQFGVALAWDPSANRWQPVQYIVYSPVVHSLNDPDIAGVRY